MSAVTTPNRYDDQGLARLLQTLRPAPDDWVQRAQQIPVGPPLTDADVAELSQRLERDAGFREQFDADPVAAADDAGMPALATQLRREMRDLVTVAERITNDDAYRSQLEEDPRAAVVAAGIPCETTEPLLRAFAMPAELIDKVPEVSAHTMEKLSPKARLVILLLGTSAVGALIRSSAAD
jgi:hypothetical protein